MSYFHFQNDEVNFNEKLQSQRCEFLKRNNQRCKNRCLIGLELCHVHTKSQLHLQIKKLTIPDAGKGLFAVGLSNEIVFRVGQKIVDYNGEIIDEDELDERYGDGTGPYAVKLHRNLYEDASVFRGTGSLANHTNRKTKINARLSIKRNNTCQLICFKKNIKSGDEILVDYDNEYTFDDDTCISTNRSKYNC